jgi:FtsP/CotA-like multicopper oxidase with cupredoxin domain
MHLHGFNMYILHDGLGSWDNATIIRPENPQRRDVFQVRPKGHLVMQFDASENPGKNHAVTDSRIRLTTLGMWPFHCHIAWHVSGGFFIQFLTNPEELQQLQPPPEVCETCRQWANWTDTNIPPQIDSGL